MLQLTHLFLGVVALLASAATLSPRLDELTRSIIAAFSMICWAYWAVSSMTVNVAGQTTETYVGLAAIGASASAVMLVSLVRLAFVSAGEELNQEPINL